MKEFKKFTGLALLIMGLIVMLVFIINITRIMDYGLEKNFSIEKQNLINNYCIAFGINSLIGSSMAIIGSILLIGVNGEKEK